jgi:hypothetical protein
MGSFFDDAHREGLLARLARLTPDTPARWGSMDAPRMLAHLSDALRMSLGDLPCEPRPGPMRFPPLRWLVIRVLPWPRGTPTAPELLARAPGDWAGEMETFRALAGRLAARGPAGPFATHPAFGDVPGPLLGLLVAKHVDHHLRQFGA